MIEEGGELVREYTWTWSEIMAHFGKDVDNFSATRTIHIVGVETNEKYTVGQG